ncbi:AAA ATPase, central region (plasmid) [Rhodoferax ferrireducens T118]|uniref:AAA ATPase, central region n=1 Tax=Albidiferax ferrireducens (strain ATCC BAA-621 / DSM 15236 / T118) TaxID=338969 RepID=Q21QK3_ALBFT|nr:AAA family ATPase [Rhodoferax ferrireducens]ABD71942.1 AAA ATPase, central region [Rhodoferax ferrireducens T118]
MDAETKRSITLVPDNSLGLTVIATVLAFCLYVWLVNSAMARAPFVSWASSSSAVTAVQWGGMIYFLCIFAAQIPEATIRAATYLYVFFFPFLMAVVAAVTAQGIGEFGPVMLPLAFLTVGIIFPVLIGWLMAVTTRTVIRFFIISPVAWSAGIKSPQADLPKGQNTTEVQRPQPAENSTANTETQSHSFAWKNPTVGLDSMVGMADFKAELLKNIQPFRDYAARKGTVADTNGILLSGPSGNGKTTIAELIAGELGLPFVKLGCQDLTSKWVNESPAVLKELFRQAALEPCVVFFDEFDGVAMSRGNGNMHDEDRKLVTALLSEIDNARKSRIVLIAATNFAEKIDSAIARDGRFDFRIEVPYPDQEAREAILRGMLKKFNVTAEESTVHHVAELWVRRSIAFIESTVKRLRDNGKGIKSTIATVEDFKQASREASRRASAIPNFGAKLSEIALTSEVRRETDSLVYRLRHWEEITERGGEPPSGVLLYGPPGTGKTNLVRALARELEYWHVFEVNASDVLQDPRKFRDTMDLASNHRPAIIFIDEADELLRDRTHSNAAGATNEILKAMDGMMGKIPEIVFMAATNNAEIIDGAALRGGRFAEKIFMGKLTGEDLVTFLEKDFVSKTKVTFAPDLTPRALAAKLREAAPSDALGLLRKAINYTFGQGCDARPVCMADIDKAIISTQL